MLENGTLKKYLINLIGIGAKIEKEWKNQAIRLEAIDQFQSQFLAANFSGMPHLKKLQSVLASTKKWESPRQLLTFLVPLERELGRNAKEADFLVTKKDAPTPFQRIPCQLILHNIRSGFNVGSLFRTADSTHLDHIHLTGYTQSPEHPSVKKTALGSERHTPWSYHSSLNDVISHLKSRNYTIYALETAQSSQSVFQTQLQAKAAFLVGNEQYGLSEIDLKLADQLISIPMRGYKNSLNVSVATGVVLHEYCRQKLPVVS